MVVASMYPASRVVVKPIKCEYTSIWMICCFENIEMWFIGESESLSII